MFFKILNVTLLSTLLALVIIPNACYSHEKLSDTIKQARDSFSFINVRIKITPIACRYIESKSGKNEIKSCDISKLMPKMLNTYGSGIVVKHVINATYVLTAAHVCSHKSYDIKTVGHKKIKVSVIPTSYVRDVYGRQYNTSVFALDAKNDLCILKVNTLFGTVAKIAEKMPKAPALVFTYAAPFAINHPGMVLLYSGYTGGEHFQSELERTVYFHTLVARPGSSGAGILDKNGHIVGVIHTAVTNLQDLAISASLESIIKITNSIPEVDYIRIDGSL
jgi:hypothetical protein